MDLRDERGELSNAWMACAHQRFLLLAEHVFGVHALDGARLLGKRRRRANHDHRSDARGRERGHVQRGDAAAAQADDLDAFDAQMIEQRERVAC